MARYLTSAAVNEPRDKHFAYNPVTGLHERTLLLEGSSTNLCLQSEDFSSATWVKGGTPVTTSGAIPASVMGVALDLLADDDAAAAELYAQPVTFTADGTKAVAIYMKKGPGPAAAGAAVTLFDTTAAATRLNATVTWDASGVPTVTMATGTLQETPREIANGIYRIMLIAPGVVAANTNLVRVYPAGLTAANTGDVYAGGVQAENNAFCTSYVKTTTATVTRSADSCSLPFTLPPQEMTVYAKFIERGSVGLSTLPRVVHIGGNADTSCLMLYGTGTAYRAFHHNGTASVTSTAAATPAIGDTVELRMVLGSDGKVTLGQSINSAAEAVAAASAANAIPSAWLAQTMSLGVRAGAASTTGFFAFQSVKVARGTLTLAQMRAL